MAMLFGDPFDTLLNLQQALESFSKSGWLEPGLSSGGSYPPVNVFRKGDDVVIIAEVPGIKKSDLELEVKGNTIRISGTKSPHHEEKASLHRRERLAGRFDRSITLPVQIEADRIKADCRDGLLTLTLRRAEQDKPKTIKIH
jgi:HSP20 family protein